MSDGCSSSDTNHLGERLLNVRTPVWDGLLLVSVFLVTLVGTWAYRSFAIHRGIVANPNFRSLHQRPIPRGGGIVFSLVCICAVIALWSMALVDQSLARAIVFGGGVATVFGFADDTLQMRALTKLLVQGVLAAWVLYCFDGQLLCDLPLTPHIVDLVLNWLGLVWLMNLYNFIDGIDGMAAAGALMISVLSILAICIARPEHELILVFGLLAAGSVGFLIFNWPPASIFMGDAGSLFLGYCFCALLASTVSGGQIRLWTWVVFFGYFAGDTTTTTLVRIFITEKWYGEHRSHAYQNLARLSGSHLKVVLGVSLYHGLWLLPLTIWSSLWPSAGMLAAALALVPVILWTLRYGPKLSSS